MKKIALGLFVPVILFAAGCAPRVIPNEKIPHRLAQEVNATVWIRMPDGRLAENEVKVPAGWWVVAPSAIE